MSCKKVLCKNILKFDSWKILIIIIVFIIIINFSDQYKQLIANQWIKTAFATIGIILTIIHWKISINLIINFQKLFTVYVRIKKIKTYLFEYPYFTHNETCVILSQIAVRYSFFNLNIYIILFIFSYNCFTFSHFNKHIKRFIHSFYNFHINSKFSII